MADSDQISTDKEIETFLENAPKPEKPYTTVSSTMISKYRRCNTCGNIYYPLDYNAGYCPMAWVHNPTSKMLEIAREVRDRQEESA